MSELLTIEDVAEVLRCSRKTASVLIYGDRKRGLEPEIPSFKIGGLRRIDSEDVEAYVRRSRQATET